MANPTCRSPRIPTYYVWKSWVTYIWGDARILHQFQEVSAENSFLFFHCTLEPDPGHVSNLSCNFLGDPMLGSAKINCIHKAYGKLNHDVELNHYVRVKPCPIAHPVHAIQVLGS